MTKDFERGYLAGLIEARRVINEVNPPTYRKIINAIDSLIQETEYPSEKTTVSQSDVSSSLQERQG